MTDQAEPLSPYLRQMLGELRARDYACDKVNISVSAPLLKLGLIEKYDSQPKWPNHRKGKWRYRATAAGNAALDQGKPDGE